MLRQLLSRLLLCSVIILGQACTGLLQTAPATLSPPAEDRVGPLLTHIAFGSCLNQHRDAPVLDSIAEAAPDLFVFLGDNIYADTDDPAVIRREYRRLGEHTAFQRLRAEVPVIATWDDHDYGQNDIGADYVAKQASREAMLDFWSVPPDSPRRSREDGIYTAYYFGPPDKRVQVILLDLRWNRTPLRAVSPETYKNEKAPKRLGPYIPHTDSYAGMLGEQQWLWLEDEIQKPARIRVIASSIQMLADFTGWESWANYPAERARFMELLKRYNIDNAIIISGDTHWAEFSHSNEAGGTSLWEVTASGLTETWPAVSPNRNRYGNYYVGPNFGYLQINWNAPQPIVELGIRDENGTIVIQHDVSLKP